MTTTYIVTLITKNGLTEALNGGHDYPIIKATINAHGTLEAMSMALDMYDDMVAIKAESLDEVNARVDEDIRRIAEYEAKKLAEKEARAKREEAKAEAMSLTLAEYKAKVNRERSIKRVEREIAELEAELANKRAYLLKLRG